MYGFVNFKGFGDARLSLFRPLTVLIGPNGSGKSNVIEGVELFSFIARGRSLHEIGDIGSGAALEIRGGLQSCSRHGHDRFHLSLSAADPDFEGEEKNFLYNVGVGARPQPRIVDESLRLTQENVMIFETLGGGHKLAGDIKVRFNNFAPGPNPIERVSTNRSILSQYTDVAVGNRHLESCSRLVSIITNYLRASFAFDPIPRLMRSYERIGNPVLSRTGANLSSVLHSLSQGKETKESLARLAKWISQLPDEPLQSIDFVTTSIGDVIFGLKSSITSQLIDARMLSDGTLRALAVLTALETVTPGSRVIIEEFDNGVHPSRVKILTEAMADCCARRKLNVLVTTHNPATLDSLSEDQLAGVVFCIWDAIRKSYALVPLSEMPRRVELLQRGSLGDLVTRKVVEQYLAPHFEEDRKRDMKAWLDSLT